eukprot:TRINITY_DN2945_c0_g1_i9.p1 TRINITY_DN2945_c0_g1~~TRINITY_DN2945_c0_g1_i9.p1  ORF type:complete len:273 (-),score=45.75 TRINITY_DN2945_c0_g1_i9:33-851(-)
MRKAHSFYIIDHEYCIDVQGLLSKLADKIANKHICIFCQNLNTRNFKTCEAVQSHMVTRGHCFMNHEIFDDYRKYYDFSEFAEEAQSNEDLEIIEEHDLDEDASEDRNEGEAWQDSDSDDELEQKANKSSEDPLKPSVEEQRKLKKKSKWTYYKSKLKSASINEIGELRLPSGRLIGNRQYQNIYKQAYRPNKGEQIEKKYTELANERKAKALDLMREEENQITLFGILEYFTQKQISKAQRKADITQKRIELKTGLQLTKVNRLHNHPQNS